MAYLRVNDKNDDDTVDDVNDDDDRDEEELLRIIMRRVCRYVRRCGVHSGLSLYQSNYASCNDAMRSNEYQ